MRLSFLARAILVASLIFSTIPAIGAEILDYLPQDTLAFALVRDTQTSNEKIVKLLSIFDEAVPAPLDMALAMTGLSEGLKLDGDVLFALLPVSDPAGLPAPVFLLPVSDYAKFAESLKGDPTGEICRVTLADEDVLIAKRDDHALLMNVEHRELMQRLLATEAAVGTDQQREWLEDNDVTAIVTAAGISYAKKAAEQGATTPPSPNADPFGEPPIASDMLQLGDALPFADLFTRDVESAGLGLAIDDTTNARVRWMVKFATERAESATKPSDEKPLVGIEDKPYALAGGGDLPEEFAAILPDLFTSWSQDRAAYTGEDGFTDQDWEDVRKTHHLWLDGLRAVSVLLTPGKVGEPLLSILFVRLTVDNTKAYLESLQQLFELANKVVARSKTDIKYEFVVSPIRIAEAEGIEVSCDLGKATGDGDQHIWQAILTSVLGIDHKLSMYFCATDEHQVFLAMEAQDKLATFIEAYRKQDMGLANNLQVKQTVALMEKDTPSTCLVNPQGFVELVRTTMKSVQILGFVPEFPLYPAAPPLGVTLSADASTWQGEFVMPVEAARAMSTFTKEVEAMFR